MGAGVSERLPLPSELDGPTRTRAGLASPATEALWEAQGQTEGVRNSTADLSREGTSDPKRIPHLSQRRASPAALRRVPLLRVGAASGQRTRRKAPARPLLSRSRRKLSAPPSPRPAQGCLAPPACDACQSRWGTAALWGPVRCGAGGSATPQRWGRGSPHGRCQFLFLGTGV